MKLQMDDRVADTLQLLIVAIVFVVAIICCP